MGQAGCRYLRWNGERWLACRAAPRAGGKSISFTPPGWMDAGRAGVGEKMITSGIRPAREAKTKPEFVAS